MSDELIQQCRAIIFDCDGTLTDSMPVHYRAWSKTFGKHGIEFTEERFYAMGGMPTDRIIRTLAEENGAEGEAFLAEYAQRRGVQQFESGLQMLQLEAGSGKQLETGDRIQYLFKLSLPDGEVIDGTEPSQPEPYRVGGQHLKGLMEAFPKMKVGDRWQVVIPSDLAFGKQGNRGLIGPNQTLVYEIEVVGLID